jgi:hypothetical protein
MLCSGEGLGSRHRTTTGDLTHLSACDQGITERRDEGAIDGHLYGKW